MPCCAATVGLVSLGCPKNTVDGEYILGLLRLGGFEIKNDPALCDAIIINTCGFLTAAKEEGIENILEFAALKNEGKIKVIAVTGCLAERYGEELALELPEVDVVLGLGSNADIADAIKEALTGKRVISLDKGKTPVECGERVLTTLPFFAYLKIADGCDNHCSYCAIPSIRGTFRSRPEKEILDEASRLCANGVRELVLVAQDTTAYGTDLYGEPALPRLLAELCKIDGLRWLRLLYCYPDKITDELIATIANQDKIVKYIDIPIQHCNSRILSLMNRPVIDLPALIAKLRHRIDGIVIRTTVIAGFPTETDSEFTQLCEFVKALRFERLGCFAYSQEEGTAAGEMDGQLGDDEKESRANIVMNEQYLVLEEYNNKQIGKTFSAVCEGYDRYAECYFGRTYADAPDIDTKLFIKSDQPLKIGQFVSVLITDVIDYDLIGVVTDYESAE